MSARLRRFLLFTVVIVCDSSGRIWRAYHRQFQLRGRTDRVP